MTNQPPYSTLFLDRDGVLNTEREKDYVKSWSEFQFEPGVFEALEILQPLFERIIIVTNQRGVGAGIMRPEDLEDIHGKMLEAFQQRGIQIAKIYSATDEDRSSIKRKPHPYMGQCAKEDFPEIRFEKSIMVGNTSSDMAFGKSLGMKTVFIDDKKVVFSIANLEHADFLADSLLDFATKLDDGSIQI